MAGGYLRFNGSFIKRIPMPRRFPMFISHLGKILQFLSQLKYSLNSSSFDYLRNPKLKKFKEKYNDEISSFLTFFNNLSNSLVKLLFLDDFYLNNDLNYNKLRNLLDLRGNYYQIPFKFVIPNYHIKKYRNYSLDELDCILIEIIKLYNQIQSNSGLLQQIDNILKLNSFNNNSN
jgi:hypothetical protein